MPWKVSDPVSQRMIFISRLLDGEKMSDLCRAFGVSRKTGHKIYNRYIAEGLDGLADESRAPRSRPNRTPAEVEDAIVELREKYSTWGAPKIRAKLQKRFDRVPATSTVHTILERHNFIKKQKRQRVMKAEGTDLRETTEPNQLWCVDFKGQFKMADQTYCYPLTVTDHMSRYLLGCEAFSRIAERDCMRAFDELFKEYGLPDAIRSDNGVPFGSKSYFRLSKLSLRWIRYGIKLERITPGCPEQNGRHERMHRTLKAEATQPQEDLMLQQELLERFKHIYNNERPHQALEMKAPVDLYKKSNRKFNPVIEPLEYPEHDEVRRVTNSGSVYITRTQKIWLGKIFAYENVGLKRLDQDTWKVSYMNYDLGFFDDKNPVLEIAANPFLQSSIK